MTETATTDGPEQPAPAERAAEVEERLPLRDLDRAMAPVRRMVAWALSPRGRPSPYLGANLRPHAARALGLTLPEALLSPLAEMDAALARLDAAEDPRVVLSERSRPLLPTGLAAAARAQRLRRAGRTTRRNSLATLGSSWNT